MLGAFWPVRESFCSVRRFNSLAGYVAGLKSCGSTLKLDWLVGQMVFDLGVISRTALARAQHHHHMCGQYQWQVPSDPNKLKLKPSNLSDTRIINPTMHIGLSEKQDWFQIPEGVKTCDGQP